MPNDQDDGCKIVWKDGAATKAYRQGCWLLLDNLDQADPCVLERINPLLEQPSTWVLTEQGHTDALKCQVGQDGTISAGPAAGFGVFATMNSQIRPSPLSPALANRFTVYSMQDISRDDQQGFDQEVESLARALLGVDTAPDILLVQSFCGWLFSKGICSTSGRLVQLLDKAFLLALRHKWDIPQSLAHAASVLFGRHADMHQKVGKYFQQAHGMNEEQFNLPCPFAIAEARSSAKSQHVLTKYRQELATTVDTCIDCNTPVLLEVRRP